jgi:hypothetical protein
VASEEGTFFNILFVLGFEVALETLVDCVDEEEFD